MGREDWPENNVWGEEEAIWFVKMVLPYLNEFVLQLRGLFSGDPAMTMKVYLPSHPSVRPSVLNWILYC